MEVGPASLVATGAARCLAPKDLITTCRTELAAAGVADYCGGTARQLCGRRPLRDLSHRKCLATAIPCPTLHQKLCSRNVLGAMRSVRLLGRGRKSDLPIVF